MFESGAGLPRPPFLHGGFDKRTRQQIHKLTKLENCWSNGWKGKEDKEGGGIRLKNSGYRAACSAVQWPGVGGGGGVLALHLSYVTGGLTVPCVHVPGAPCRTTAPLNPSRWRFYSCWPISWQREDELSRRHRRRYQHLFVDLAGQHGLSAQHGDY